jgi:NAD(P)-dependent dehydrogenase (short-subunit alcohol dehydrogenase family)
MRLHNKRALITGGAQGIGYAIAEAFCREGAIVYIADVNDDLGSSAAKRLRDKGAKATFIRLDVASEIDWQRVFKQID